MRILDILLKSDDPRSPHFSSGFFLSIFLGVAFTVIVAILVEMLGKGTMQKLGAFSLFFFISFICLFLCIEWFLDREQKRIEDLQKEEIANLKKVEIFRREFLAEVSHELRTPIFAVQGFIHTLMDGAIDDEEVRLVFLKKAMKNTDRLSNLVNDLLIITQIEAGELEMKMRRFYIFDLLEDVIESVEHKFTKRNRNIHYSIQSNSHENTFVRADRERIQQVLTNLVDNAIKYGNPDGNIDIILEQIDDKIWVRVRDESPGIAPEHLENIFRRFYRIDKSRSREKGGTGLGLSICKHFIEAHGETLSVHSILGVGTTFSFSLKVAEKSQETSPKNA